ncbi:RDD family protein [Pseudoxanthobacter sp.]|uniref:RDD family protein n=1 Tax=Pseudoxanthobacter sp. TaxID=1925742 RepID=UPI002FE3FB5E
MSELSPGSTTTASLYERPALFAGVRRRRCVAFLFDVLMILVLTLIAGVAVFFLGLVTLGLGWSLYVFLWEAVALAYAAFTLGGPRSATPGMRMLGLEMRLWHGGRAYPLMAMAHSLLFWLSVTILTPFVLLVGLIDERKRLLHDLVLGTLIVDSDAVARLEGQPRR